MVDFDKVNGPVLIPRPLTEDEKRQIDKEIARWKRNPNYIPIIPVPVTVGEKIDE